MPGWCYTLHLYNTVAFGDRVAACRIEIRVYCTLDTDYNLKDLGNDSFEVQRYGTWTRLPGNIRTWSSLLPPALFPSEALYTIDQRYLDCNHVPIVSHLLKPMLIELYKDKWMQPHQSNIPTSSKIVDLPSSGLDAISFEPHNIL